MPPFTRQRRAAALGLLAFAGAAAAAPVRPVVAVVVEAEGEPLLNGKPLKKNAFVYEGGTIETRAGGCVAAAMVQGAEVRLNENSELRMDGGGGARGGIVFLRAGQAWARVMFGKSGLEIAGPQAVVALRAAEADVAVGSRTFVKIYEGSADVSNDRGLRSVAAMQRTWVEGAAQPPAEPTSLLPQERGTWQDRCAGKERGAGPGPGLHIRRKPAAPTPGVQGPAGP